MNEIERLERAIVDTKALLFEGSKRLGPALLALRDYDFITERGVPEDAEERAKLTNAVDEARQAMAEASERLPKLEAELARARLLEKRQGTWKRLQELAAKRMHQEGGQEMLRYIAARERYARAKEAAITEREREVQRQHASIDKLRAALELLADDARQATRLQADIDSATERLEQTKKSRVWSRDMHYALIEVGERAAVLFKMFPELTDWIGGVATDAYLEELAGPLD